MERLFRDRMKYLTHTKDEGCFLCTAAGSKSSAEHLVLARASHCFAILNKYPYNTGHLMVAPFEHLADLDEVDEHVVGEMMQLVRRCIAALRETMKPQGFNFGANLGAAAGAGVPGHLHLHVVPRWGGDTNFMPVVAGSKILPETLDQTYERLRTQFD